MAEKDKDKSKRQRKRLGVLNGTFVLFMFGPQLVREESKLVVIVVLVINQIVSLLLFGTRYPVPVHCR
jgi:hypothetical protein